MAGAYWKVAALLPESAARAVETAFDGVSLAASAFEVDEAKKLWTVEILCDKPQVDEMKSRLLALAAAHDASAPILTLEKLEQKDWLAQVASSFPPFTIGRFYIHGSHVKEKPPAASIAIQVDAGAAFGSGEHGTTGTCLEALDWLAKKRDFKNVLDMGCGSGILAIAAAKLWRAEILAADIDEVAVRVTAENARINRATLETVVSDGYLSERVKRRGPYDLIVSNILARPLVAFAPSLAKNLAGGGVAILSGLLSSQEAQVKNAHTAQGLTFQRRFASGDWRTLVFEK